MIAGDEGEIFHFRIDHEAIAPAGMFRSQDECAFRQAFAAAHLFLDAADKVQAYANWLGLMQGDLTEEVTKGERTFTRYLNPDVDYYTPDEKETYRVRCRALMLVRNVGHLMTNPAILDRDGNEAPEGLLDAMITAMIALCASSVPS